MADGKSSKGQRGREAPPSVEEESSEDNPFRHLGGLQLLAMRRRMRPREIVPLPEKVRDPMERSFGENFSDVKVHEDSSRAGGSVHALTEGNEIHFAPGRFSPDTHEGKHLIAHELAHVAQQRIGGHALQAFIEGDQRPLLEQDAEAAAHQAVVGQAARVRFHAPAGMKLRFESWEHYKLGMQGGDKNFRFKLNKGNIELNYGEVVALAGDFYGTPDALKNAEPEEVKELLRIIHRQVDQAAANGGQPTEKQTAANEKAFQEATSWREEKVYQHGKDTGKTKGEALRTEGASYLSLADNNWEHFSPENLEKWKKAHVVAMELAASSLPIKTFGEKEVNQLSQALFHEAFHQHFLTDAFASGHLVSGKIGREAGQKFWATHRSEIDYVLQIAEQRDHSPLTGIPHIIYFQEAESKVPSLCLKLVHDHFNRTGLRVTNQNGQSWVTYGDANLSKAPEAEQIATEAVAISRKEVEMAAATGRMTNEPAALKLVPYRLEYGNKEFPINMIVADFAEKADLFESFLEPIILEPSALNPLYQLVKSNLGMLQPTVEQWSSDKVHAIVPGLERMSKTVGSAVAGAARHILPGRKIGQ